jgi:tyrosyl-tRNA synthetase
MIKQNFIEELKWRNMLQDSMPGTEELLNKEMVTGYIGFDPTADSLGVGNLVQIMTLMHFQRAGHKPMALVGGATGMVGDPSGKSAERNLLDENTLQHNLACQRAQLERFLDFDCGENSAEIVNNYDWFKNFGFLEFIRDVGKHISVNYMLAKDSVKNRLENGMSFTEFSYQLVQGYDFYWLAQNKGVKLQMGGSDQWGNIVTGTELIRRKGGGEAWALTTPLIKKADGTKFGKSEGGNIWLDRKRTSPYQFYQFWLNASDVDIANFIRIFSLSNRETIEAMVIAHNEAPHLRLLQKSLAEELTIRVHSPEDFASVQLVTELLFGNKAGKEALMSLSINDLETVGGEIKAFEVSRTDFETAATIIDLVADKTQIFASRGEARRAITANAVSLNKEKISDPEFLINATQLLHAQYMMIENGKKNKFLIKIMN